MGRDLRLLPIQPSDNRWLAFSVLSLERQYEVFDAISALGPEKVPAILDGVTSWLGDEGEWATTKVDEYDAPLTYITAGQLAELNVDEKETHRTNMAALAYCLALPPETPVILFWH